MAISVNISATNNTEIEGLLAGTKWSGTALSSLSGGDGETTTSGFSAAPVQMQAAINDAIALIKGYTNASITYNGIATADLLPGNYAAAGDVWFGTQYDYTQAQLGNYYFTTALHELVPCAGP